MPVDSCIGSLSPEPKDVRPGRKIFHYYTNKIIEGAHGIEKNEQLMPPPGLPRVYTFACMSNANPASIKHKKHKMKCATSPDLAEIFAHWKIDLPTLLHTEVLKLLSSPSLDAEGMQGGQDIEAKYDAMIAALDAKYAEYEFTVGR